MRLVSLACSNTEIVAALGCADRLVGVDSHSDFPAEVVTTLPRVGPDLEIDIDAVAALKPDLVLATLTVPGHETVVEGLEQAGLPFIAPSPETLEDVYRDIETIAELLGVVERGREVVEEMRAELEVPRTSGGPRLLVEWWPKPVIGPGNLSWTHHVLEAAGARNALESVDHKSRPFTDEEILEIAPDAFVISWCGVAPAKYRPDVVLNNPVWQDMASIKNGHVYTVPEAFLGRPGPRLVEGVRALRAIVAQTHEGLSA